MILLHNNVNVFTFMKLITKFQIFIKTFGSNKHILVKLPNTKYLTKLKNFGFNIFKIDKL